jgi:hypothetical protein
MTRRMSWTVTVIAGCLLGAGCGGGGPRRVEPRTPTAAEIEEAERTSRDAEAAEREAFQQPPARPGQTR